MIKFKDAMKNIVSVENEAKNKNSNEQNKNMFLFILGEIVIFNI